MSSQLVLDLGDWDHARLAASRVRQAVHAAAHTYGVKALADEWSMSEEEARLRLLDKERHPLHLEHVMSVLLHEQSRAALAVMNDACGCEPPARKHALTDSERAARMQMAIESLGPVLAEFVMRKAGL